MITQTRPHLERTLGAITEHVDQFDAVCKRELQFGDCVQVRTRNSTYSIRVLGGDLYSVSGGSRTRGTRTGLTWKACRRSRPPLTDAPGVAGPSR